MLGLEEFVDETIRRVWQADRKEQKKAGGHEFDADRLIAAVKNVSGLAEEDFIGSIKLAEAVRAKEALIVAGPSAGSNMRTLERSSASTTRPSAAATTLHDDIRQ